MDCAVSKMELWEIYHDYIHQNGENVDSLRIKLYWRLHKNPSIGLGSAKVRNFRPQTLKVLPWQLMLAEHNEKLIKCRSSEGKPMWKI